MQHTPWDHALKVTGDGAGLVGHAGAILLRKAADQAGLTAWLGAALQKAGKSPSPAENGGRARQHALPGRGRRGRHHGGGDDHVHAAARPATQCQHRLFPLSVSCQRGNTDGLPLAAFWQQALKRH